MKTIPKQIIQHLRDFYQDTRIGITRSLRYQYSVINKVKLTVKFLFQKSVLRAPNPIFKSQIVIKQRLCGIKILKKIKNKQTDKQVKRNENKKR